MFSPEQVEEIGKISHCENPEEIKCSDIHEHDEKLEINYWENTNWVESLLNEGYKVVLFGEAKEIFLISEITEHFKDFEGFKAENFQTFSYKGKSRMSQKLEYLTQGALENMVDAINPEKHRTYSFHLLENYEI